MSQNMIGGCGIAFALVGILFCWLAIKHARSGMDGARYVVFLAIDYFIFSATFIVLYLHPEKKELCYGIFACNAVLWAFLEHKRKKSLE